MQHRFFNFKSITAAVGVTIVALLTMGATGCGPSPAPPPGGTSLTITAVLDSVGPYAPTFLLNNSFGSPVVPMLTGHVNSCFNTDPGALGIYAQCRVVNGFDNALTNQTDHIDPNGTGALYDHTDWIVKIIAGHPATVRQTLSRYGLSIATYHTPACQGDCSPNGASNMFEGCTKLASWDCYWPLHSAQTSTDTYRCNYAVYDMAPTHPFQHSGAWDQIEGQTWPSLVHDFVEPTLCAVGVMGLTAGDPWIEKGAGPVGCVMVLRPQGTSAPSPAGGDTTSNNVLPGDPVQPGDPTPDLPPTPDDFPVPTTTTTTVVP